MFDFSEFLNRGQFEASEYLNEESNASDDGF